MVRLRMHPQSRRALAALSIFLSGGCTPELSDSPLPERSGAVDTTALPPHFGSTGGPVLLRLTGWANPVVLRQFEAAGLRPLPAHDSVARLDSVGMNVVGGTVPPKGLESILEIRYIMSIEPLEDQR